MREILKDMIQIAKLVGSKIKELREENSFTEKIKNGHELVTTADLISDEIIQSEIKKKYPDHRIISEENEVENIFIVDEPVWIIDPIDGTVGYANNQYQVAISIAYAEGGKVVAAVVYNPFLEETFHAEIGQGAFLNGRSIQAKKVDSLKECVVGTGFPHNKEKVEHILDALRVVLPKIRDLRRLGSPALDICWVACGRMQGFYEEKLFPWDVAAAKLIAIEAGAVVGNYGTNLDGLPEDISCRNVIVTSSGVFDELKTTLESVL